MASEFVGVLSFCHSCCAASNCDSQQQHPTRLQPAAAWPGHPTLPGLQPADAIYSVPGGRV